MSMRAVIVGAGGFIGRRLAARLRASGAEVTCLDRVADASLDIHACDVVRDPIILPDGVDAAWYLCQSPHYRRFPEGCEDLFEVNALGALRVARAAANAGARHFAYASTGNVYACGFEPFTESRPLRRDDPYALSKVMGEELIALLRPSFPAVALRLFGVFGPGQQGMLVPQLIARIAAGEPILLQPRPDGVADDGGLRISLRFVDDLVQDLLSLAGAALAGTALPPSINLGGAEAVSIRGLAMMLADAAGLPVRFETGAAPRRTDLIADVSRLHALVPVSTTPLTEAVRRTIGVPPVRGARAAAGQQG
ncbi:MAG: NAD(P)-dependent oxidoreductase [Phycisphaeraceae bacterium]|nr:NAD(P)-dependent oxidoreductase [Phycisphaeraceae bacterium]